MGFDIKTGWHPGKGKDSSSTSRSKEGRNKGIDQIKGLVGKVKGGSKDDDDDAPEHVARPLASLKDPYSFGPPPKKYADGHAAVRSTPPPPQTPSRSDPHARQQSQQYQPQYQQQYTPPYDQQQAYGQGVSAQYQPPQQQYQGGGHQYQQPPPGPPQTPQYGYTPDQPAPAYGSNPYGPPMPFQQQQPQQPPPQSPPHQSQQGAYGAPMPAPPPRAETDFQPQQPHQQPAQYPPPPSAPARSQTWQSASCSGSTPPPPPPQPAQRSQGRPVPQLPPRLPSRTSDAPALATAYPQSSPQHPDGGLSSAYGAQQQQQQQQQQQNGQQPYHDSSQGQAMYQPPIQSGYHQPNGSNAPSYGVPGPQPGYGQGMSSEAQALGTTPAMPQAAMLNLSAAGVHVPGLGIGGGHPSQPQPPQQSPPPLHQPAPQYAPGSAPSQQVAQATHELQQRFANLGLSRQTTETSSQYSRESGFNAAPQAQQQAYDYAPPAQPQPVQDYQQSQPVPQQQQGHLPSQPAPRQPSVSSVPSVIGKKKPPPPPPKKKNIALPGQIPAPAGPPPAAAAAPAQPAQGSLYGPPLPFGAPRPY